MVFNLLNKLNDANDLSIIALSFNEGILSDKLHEVGVETHIIPESTNSFVKICLQAFKLLKKRKIDIIHSHRYKENLIALVLAKSLGVRRLVTTLHGLPEPPPNLQNGKTTIGIKSKVNDYILRNFFNHIIVVSNEMKTVLVQTNEFEQNKIDVIYNGIPVPWSSRSLDPPPHRLLDPSNDFFHIGSVGRMVPVKDYNLFLEVAVEVSKLVNNVRFSILGEGPLKGQLLQKVRELSMEDRVEFLPPRPDPLSYYKSLDLYVNTSLHEGIPLSILEAMACGKPVVAPRVGGIPEIIIHGENGLLADSREAKEIAELCANILEEKISYDNLCKNAAERISSMFSVDEMAKSYQNLYRNRD